MCSWFSSRLAACRESLQTARRAGTVAEGGWSSKLLFFFPVLVFGSSSPCLRRHPGLFGELRLSSFILPAVSSFLLLRHPASCLLLCSVKEAVRVRSKVASERGAVVLVAVVGLLGLLCAAFRIRRFFEVHAPLLRDLLWSPQYFCSRSCLVSYVASCPDFCTLLEIPLKTMLPSSVPLHLWLLPSDCAFQSSAEPRSS